MSKKAVLNPEGESIEVESVATEKETAAFQSIMEYSKEKLASLHFPNDLVFLKPNLDECAVCVISENNPVCYIRIRKKAHYLLFPENVANLLPKSAEIKQLPSDVGYYRAVLSGQESMEIFVDAFVASISDRLEKYHTFSCCSRYEECSDAKHCTHPDFVQSLGCGYKKRLRAGIIYYGKNRNVN